MTGAPTTVEDRVVYVRSGRGSVFGLLTVPPADRVRRTPVLLCGPWGWEDISAHRPLRTWAHHLARDGRATLRIDLPGTGDSPGAPTDPELVEAWRAAVLDSAAWLAEAGGTPSVSVVAIGLSGLLVCDVLREPGAAAIGDLAVWGVEARGRRAVRQLEAFARMEATSASIDEHGEVVDEPAVEDPRLAPGGYLLADETQAALRAIDLATLPAEAVRGRRMLLLERDGMAVGAGFLSHLASSGALVERTEGAGYGEMVAHPQTAELPTGAVRAVDRWLAARPGDAGGSGSFARGADPELVVDGVRETPLDPGPGGPRVFGILAEPTGEVTSDCTVIFLNAGAQARTGPNRMWVEAARRWAADGVPSLRMDVGSLGDAPGPDLTPISGDALHDPQNVADVASVLGLLAARGLPDRYMLVGLCSGAWVAFTAAGRDPRVASVVLFNPRALVWSPVLVDARHARVGRRVAKRSQWRRVLRGEIGRDRIHEVLCAVAGHPAGVLKRLRVRREVAASLERMSSAGVLVSLIFTGQEPLRAELERDGAMDLVRTRPGLQLVELAGRDHTLRPPSEQRLGHDLLDTELGRVLGRATRR